jgi:hypothetical protein
MSTKKQEVKLCHYLKAKNSFGVLEGGDNQWSGIDDANTQFWCVKTGDAIGPDNELVGSTVCISGRKCFRAR